jgi:hypothetical protein
MTKYASMYYRKTIYVILLTFALVTIVFSVIGISYLFGHDRDCISSAFFTDCDEPGAFLSVNSVLLLALSTTIILYTGTKIAYIDCCGDIEYEYRERARTRERERDRSRDRLNTLSRV